MASRSFDFNKQIILSEFGALLGGPLFGFGSSLFSDDLSLISFFTVAGAVAGSSFLWVFIRFFDEKKRMEYSFKSFSKGVILFTPFASLSAVIFVYPTIFFGTRILLQAGAFAAFASLIGALLGTLVYLLIMNVYRVVLHKKWDIRL